MLTIYGSDLSIFSNKVRFVANALGLEYEYKKISLRDKENQTEKFLRMNPCGKIPVIDDNGFVLFESDAIIRYLCVKNHSPLYPEALEERAIVDQWMSLVSIHVADGMGRVLFNRVFAKMRGLPPDEKSVEFGLASLKRFLPIIDGQISRQKFVGAPFLSLADFDLLAVLDSAEVAEVELSAYKNIKKWRDALRRESFYARCYSEYGLSLKTGSASKGAMRHGGKDQTGR